MRFDADKMDPESAARLEAEIDWQPRSPDTEHQVILGEGYEGHSDIFFAAVNLTRMPMALTDPNLPDNPITYCNNAFVELTGYPQEEILGRNCRFLQGPETDQSTIKLVRDAIEARTDVAVEVLNYRKNGSAFWNALFISPVFGPDKKIRYFFASQLDVSRRRDAEDSLRQAQKMEAVGQLTGGIAHDFNNLLQVILGNLSLIEEKVDGATAKLLARAIGSAEAAQTLTSQLLSFARKQRLEGRATNVNTLVATVKALVERTFDPNISLVSDLAPDTWIARVDAPNAEAALLNLLVNARDAMPTGGQITSKTYNEVVKADHRFIRKGLQPGKYAVIEVADTGTGISEDNLAHVLEPFFTTKEPGKGTGMGLAQVYGFMRQSHGFLGIDSVVGQGTSIFLYFPAVDEQVERPRQISHRQQAKGGTETILVVEDNSDVLEIAERVLSDYGYRVVIAQDADKAMELLQGGLKPDMIFTDIVMPGGRNGVTLAREAKTIDPGMKVLLTTGWAERGRGEHDRDDDYRRDGFEILGKPYKPGALISRVRAILDGASGV